MEENYKVCFIIANKYVRNYVSFIEYYVNNIKTFYKDSLVLIVDNNSTYLEEDIIQKLEKYSYTDVLLLTNNSECKFELGAYKIGMKYLLDNNLVNNYDYLICTQDTFVLKNKYDFNNLIENNIFACPIKTYIDDNCNRYHDNYNTNLVQIILNRTNLTNNINELRLCWANSFVLHKSKIEEFLNLTDDLIITQKSHSCDCERFLSAIMYKLNNYKNYTIDNMYTEEEIKPHLWNIDIPNTESKYYFVKRLTAKNENTCD
jgi:hypothetical protein